MELLHMSAAFYLSWAVMLIWIGMLTYCIDMAGIIMGWWHD